MSIDKFPQPTSDDLSAETLYWLPFNPYWWEIVQGKIGQIDNSLLWEDYSEDIEQAVHGLMLPQELPMTSPEFIGGMFYPSADIAVPNGTLTEITLDTVGFEETPGDSFLDTGVSRVRVPITGYWDFSIQMTFDGAERTERGTLYAVYWDAGDWQFGGLASWDHGLGSSNKHQTHVTKYRAHMLAGAHLRFAVVQDVSIGDATIKGGSAWTHVEIAFAGE